MSPKIHSLFALALLACSSASYAKCGCPSDGHGAPQPPAPAGDATRAADPHSAAPQFRVFEQDGLRYVERIDPSGSRSVTVRRAELAGE